MPTSKEGVYHYSELSARFGLVTSANIYLSGSASRAGLMLVVKEMNKEVSSEVDYLQVIQTYLGDFRQKKSVRIFTGCPNGRWYPCYYHGLSKVYCNAYRSNSLLGFKLTVNTQNRD